MVPFMSPPKNLWQAFKLGWTMVLKGYTGYRQDHQIILTKRG